MPGRIKVAIAGVGNCASALVQGLTYYRKHDPRAAGLMHRELGGYRVADVRPVVAFDIDRRKVGRPLETAIFARPNCTTVFCPDVPATGVTVRMGPVLDGVAAHMARYPDERAFRVADAEPVDVARALSEADADVLVCYLPVGSEQAVRHYAQACLEANVAMVNCMPVFIASDPLWARRFQDAGVPIVGDDIKSQVGATIIHRVLARLLGDRGVALDRTYQLNTGGNTDFLNMLEQARLASKKISKTESVQSQLDDRLGAADIHVGPSDYVAWQDDNKVCFLRLEWRGFGDVPMNLEARLSVEDSPNSAGVAIDAIRCAKLARDRGLGGSLLAIASYTMKHPPLQYRDSVGRQAVEAYIAGETARDSDGCEIPTVWSPPAVVEAPVRPGRARSQMTPPAVILAAGEGSRLSIFAPDTPKPCTPLLGVSFAERTIESARAAGIERFVVVLGHRAAEVRAHFAEVAGRLGVELAFVTAPYWRLGNGASALAAARSPALVDAARFLLLMCDHCLDPEIVRRVLAAPLASGEIALAVDRDRARVFDLDDLTKVSLDGPRVTMIGKELPCWDAGDAGVFLGTRVLFDALAIAAERGEHALTDAVRALAASGQVRAVEISGLGWIDVDTQAAYDEACHRVGTPTGAERTPPAPGR